MKQLIITADDFGLDEAVNEAVERAHREGILTSASLMVTGAAAVDAIARARRLPTLRVGLHLVLAGGAPALAPRQIPALVEADGRFPTDLVRAGVRFFFLPGARQQLEQEITAQFRAFRDTGLTLDHADCHSHLHLHPTVGRLLVQVGRRYGLRAVRFPREPILPSWRATRGGLRRRLATGISLLPWLALLRLQIRRAGLFANDYIFGMNDTGQMDEELLLRQLVQLPEGVSELYFHPAATRSPALVQAMPGYRQEAELAALTSTRVKQALAARGIQPVGFGSLCFP